jgi:hypothetical protein
MPLSFSARIVTLPRANVATARVSISIGTASRRTNSGRLLTEPVNGVRIRKSKWRPRWARVALLRAEPRENVRIRARLLCLSRLDRTRADISTC